MPPAYDLVCYSHLRWDFVFQRPQQLLSRFARRRRVFFIEEPLFGDRGPALDVSPRDANVFVVAPQLPDALRDRDHRDTLRALLDTLFD